MLVYLGYGPKRERELDMAPFGGGPRTTVPGWPRLVIHPLRLSPVFLPPLLSTGLMSFHIPSAIHFADPRHVDPRLGVFLVAAAPSCPSQSVIESHRPTCRLPVLVHQPLADKVDPSTAQVQMFQPDVLGDPDRRCSARYSHWHSCFVTCLKCQHGRTKSYRKPTNTRP